MSDHHPEHHPVMRACLQALFTTVLAGPAMAAIPDSTTGVYTGCYVNAGSAAGKLRVIDAEGGAVCPGGETQVEWNEAGIVWKGNWNNATAYLKGDAVAYQGSSYIALVDNVGVPPTNVANWGVLAKKGNNGAAGPAGPQGPQGLTGPQGPAGPAGNVGPAGPQGPQGVQGPQGPAGPSGPKGWASSSGIAVNGAISFYPVTVAFVAPANANCLVTSSVQMSDATPPPVGPTGTFFRNAVKRNGVDAEDGQFGHYLTSLGVAGVQPDITRTSLISVTAGQTVQFGVYLGSPTTWAGATMFASTTYLCS